MNDQMLRAPFPWFGGKSRAAPIIWPRFGDVQNYIEPFAGSLAVLLARPHPARIETVNDKDAYLANFWRACQGDPEGVARWADWPVNETDLHARHLWLATIGRERVERLLSDPDYYDVKVAGWWVWGICMWIGSGWCSKPQWKGRAHAGAFARGVQVLSRQIPYLDRGGRGIHKATQHKRPHLMHGGKGVHGPSLRLPHLSGDSGAAGMGIHASSFAKRTGGLQNCFEQLQERLRYVRVCCGDWTRVLTASVTEKVGTTAILLDPPYSDVAGRDPTIYSTEDLQVAHAVRKWAIANGDNPMLRIALCGYEGEHNMPSTWECVAWKASGGYGAQRRKGTNHNAMRERIWFSPNCLKPVSQPVQLSLIG